MHSTLPAPGHYATHLTLRARVGRVGSGASASRSRGPCSWGRTPPSTPPDPPQHRDQWVAGPGGRREAPGVLAARRRGPRPAWRVGIGLAWHGHCQALPWGVVRAGATQRKPCRWPVSRPPAHRQVAVWAWDRTGRRLAPPGQSRGGQARQRPAGRAPRRLECHV